PDQLAERGGQGEISCRCRHRPCAGRHGALYNRLLDDAGLPASQLDNFVATLLNLLRKILPHSWQLAHTIALEHYTAV
ncbi:hypothetical protein RSW31_26565, partial [Escherichia coli]|uniref:hypothetical protein n=1 Tax=Escherichia coli TaxID=562 RepID=UPI0028DFCBD9